MTEPTTPNADQPEGRETATDEFSRWVIICGYLWVIFELLSIRKSIVLSEYHLNFLEQAFAIVNFLVFAKVLLTQNHLSDLFLKVSRSIRAEGRARRRKTSLWAFDSRIRSLEITVSSSDSGA